MSLLQVYNQEGKKVSELELPQRLKEASSRKALLWETIKMQRANQRKGTHSTKTRSNVAGSTRKIYKQKGTGNARHGDIKAPIFVGGGRVWGPHPRDYSYRMPRRARREALVSALHLKFEEGKLKLLKSFDFSEIKTKKAAEFFQNMGSKKTLLIIETAKPAVEKSIRNLAHHKVLRVEGINVYDLMNHEDVLITESAFKKIEEMLQ